MIFFPGIPYLRFAKWVGLAVVILGLSAALAISRLDIAHKETVIARREGRVKVLNGEVDAANRATRECAATNKTNDAVVEEMRRDHAKSISALSDQLRRLRDEKQKTKVIRQVIHEEAKQCVGVVPPGISRAVTE